MKTKEKLPVKFKEKWVSALRSGKYKQASNSLYNSTKNGFCCLGVAANICGIGKNTLRNKGLIAKFNQELLELAIKNKKYPKLLMGSSYKSDKDYNYIVHKLVTFNDNGKSFKWIASYIERYL